VLAANQGLYNGFLAAGLFWGLFDHLPMLVNFMLGCVIVAGCYGAYSVNKRIFFIQAVPAILAVAAWWMVPA
jgi:putative membrane protein